MKQFSLALNILLVLAVGFLYFKVYSKPTPVKTSVVATPSNNAAAVGVPIAFVDLDSLNEKISFIKNKRKELETEQRAIETEWESGYRNLENQKNGFVKKHGNAITQQMAEEFQTQLMQQQQRIDEKKQSLTQRLSEKSYRTMDEIQKQLKDFLAEYNKQKNYTYILTTGTGLDYMVYKDSSLNITADVVSGMNDRLKKDKK